VPQTYKSAALRSLPRVTHGRFGNWELSKAELPVMYGFTGRFQSLGRQRRNEPTTRPLRFTAGIE
jgi:hypothetical protein